jgi:hypothetical protein
MDDNRNIQCDGVNKGMAEVVLSKVQNETLPIQFRSNIHPRLFVQFPGSTYFARLR